MQLAGVRGGSYGRLLMGVGKLRFFLRPLASASAYGTRLMHVRPPKLAVRCPRGDLCFIGTHAVLSPGAIMRPEERRRGLVERAGRTTAHSDPGG
jgi:hypothetical protein